MMSQAPPSHLSDKIDQATPRSPLLTPPSPDLGFDLMDRTKAGRLSSTGSQSWLPEAKDSNVQSFTLKLLPGSDKGRGVASWLRPFEKAR